MTGPLLLAPLRIEQRALRRGGAETGAGASATPGTVTVVRTGMGEPKSLARAAEAAAAPAVLVAGMGAGMAGLRPGDIVVATELRHPDGGVYPCPWADALVRALRPLPVPVYAGPVATVRTLVRPGERGPLAEAGVLAADMESAFLLAGAPSDLRGEAPADAGVDPSFDAAVRGGRPWAVVRVVSDAPGHELLRPGIVRNGLRAYRSLKAAAPTLSAWLTEAAGAPAPESAASAPPTGPDAADWGTGPRGSTANEQDGGAR